MANQTTVETTRERESGTEQDSGVESVEVMRHAQDMTNDVLYHMPKAAGDVLRETPILMGHLKENILGWFRPKERGGHGNHPHR